MSHENSEKPEVTKLRKAGLLGLSIINPLSDLKVIYRKGVKPATERVREAWTLLNRQSTPSESLDWAQAVARSGRSAEQLNATYGRIRFSWWCLMVITGGVAVLLSIMALLAHNLPSGTLFRVVITILVLTGASALGFVKALITTYRLWQLQQRRVSEREGGTFKHFLAENRWCHLVLTLGRFDQPIKQDRSHEDY